MAMFRGLGIIAIVALIAAYFSVFFVKETEKAVLFRLGEIVKADYTPGLYFKIPFVNNVRKFDARILTLDAQPEEYLTSEKKNVIVDSFVKWRITDAGTYYRSMGGDERRAMDRITQIIKDGLRNEFGKRTIQEAVSGERAQIMESLAVNARTSLAQFGMDVVDVRIKRIDLPRDVSDSVYDRMEAERSRVAKDFRSRGEEEAERIRADADRQSEIIVAEAYRDAERIRGEGDKTASKIYADAFSKDPKFYALYRSLNAYKASFADKGDIVVLEPDADFFKFFNNPATTK